MADLLLAPLLVLWSAGQAVALYGLVYFAGRLSRPPRAGAVAGRIAIISPVRGAGPNLERFVASLLAQEGVATPRITFVVESADDPAYPVVASAARNRPAQVDVVVAGLADGLAQKVHNQLAALAGLSPDAEFLVFVDADTIFPPSAVARLVRPLLKRDVIVSGYRWLAPEDGHPATHLATALNLQIATLPKRVSWNLPWAGAMAMRAETFRRLHIAERWRDAVIDDLTIYRAARQAGVGILMPYDLLVRSPVAHDGQSLFNFGVRQYRHVLLHAPRFWAFALAVLGGLSLGWLAVLGAALSGSRLGLLGVLVGYLFALARAAVRLVIARRLFGPEGVRDIRASLVIDALLPMGLVWLHLLMVALAATSRVIHWAGVSYEIRDGRVVSMRRAAEPQGDGGSANSGRGTGGAPSNSTSPSRS